MRRGFSVQGLGGAAPGTVVMAVPGEGEAGIGVGNDEVVVPQVGVGLGSAYGLLVPMHIRERKTGCPLGARWMAG